MRRNGDLHERVTKAVLGSQELPTDPESLEGLPTLCELLWPRFKAGKCVRESGRLSLKIIGGYYVVTVYCPSEGVQTTIVVSRLLGLLEGLEERLRDPTTIWLPDYESQKKSRREAKG